jgi:hypothetical protein
MDWISITFATFFISFGVVVIILVIDVFYRMDIKPLIGDLKDPKAEKKREEEEKAEDTKVGNWIAPYFGIAALALGLWKLDIISSALVGIFSFPSLLGAWFIIRFKYKREKTDLVFADIFRHPIQNLGLFLFFCSIIILCIIFIVPLVILTYG